MATISWTNERLKNTPAHVTKESHGLLGSGIWTGPPLAFAAYCISHLHRYSKVFSSLSETRFAPSLEFKTAGTPGETAFQVCQSRGGGERSRGSFHCLIGKEQGELWLKTQQERVYTSHSTYFCIGELWLKTRRERVYTFHSTYCIETDKKGIHLHHFCCFLCIFLSYSDPKFLAIASFLLLLLPLSPPRARLRAKQPSRAIFVPVQRILTTWERRTKKPNAWKSEQNNSVSPRPPTPPKNLRGKKPTSRKAE